MGKVKGLNTIPSTHMKVGHSGSYLYPQHARLGRFGHKQVDPVIMLGETVSKRKVGRASEMTRGGGGKGSRLTT